MRAPVALLGDPEIGSSAVCLWARLARYAGAVPEISTLAADLGCGPASVDQDLAQLVAGGWITRRRPYPGGPTITEVYTEPHPPTV